MPTDAQRNGNGLNPIVRLRVNPAIPSGEIQVGGVQVLRAPTDEELGRGVRTKLVTVATIGHAEALRQALRRDGFEVEWEIEVLS